MKVKQLNTLIEQAVTHRFFPVHETLKHRGWLKQSRELLQPGERGI
ncbi:hypothetical protein GLW04_13355 [Halobacillus litoralis]|uniref:Uncharacterized protein n=1 Tax=Halobacillus litoralis TaxID=45668 RepID=A0A845E5G9_9BACI|nr:hypothetical protein [Halobacillus litoralis]MYL20884.1 hypothetical protein [Halobacillus litoralis]